jgi:hypothetical protein
METPTAKDTIYIERLPDGAFSVRIGDRCAEGLTWEEMLGVVSAATIPRPPRCLTWLRTQAEQDEWQERLKGIAERTRDESARTA